MHPVTIRELPGRRVVGLPHLGPYPEVGPVFERVWAALGAAGLRQQAGHGVMVAFSDPDAVPASALESFAGVLMAEEVPCPVGLQDCRLAGGRHAVMAHRGPYGTLKEAYGHIYGPWMAEAGEIPGRGPSHEVYLNDPSETAPDDLRTDICVPLA